MAKNITLMGANYPDVPAVDLPQTGGGSARFVDMDSIVGQPGSNLYTTSLAANGTLKLNNAKIGMIVVLNRNANNVKEVFGIDAALSVTHIVGTSGNFTFSLSNGELTIQSSLNSIVTVVVIRPYT